MNNVDKAKEDKVRESGDLIQPIEKDKFIKKFGYHPNESKSEIDKYLRRRGLGNKVYPDYSEKNDNRNR